MLGDLESEGAGSVRAQVVQDVPQDLHQAHEALGLRLQEAVQQPSQLVLEQDRLWGGAAAPDLPCSSTSSSSGRGGLTCPLATSPSRSTGRLSPSPQPAPSGTAMCWEAQGREEEGDPHPVRRGSSVFQVEHEPDHLADVLSWQMSYLERRPKSPTSELPPTQKF